MTSRRRPLPEQWKPRTRKQHKQKPRLAQQMAFDLPAKNTWGGRRKGAGRKAKRGKRVSHGRRPRFDGKRYPLHLTWRLVADIPNLRDKLYEVILSELEVAKDRYGLRINTYVIEETHLHMTAEALSAQACGKGMQVFGSRMAKRLNKEIGRKGPVVEDHYHARIIRVPTQMLRTLIYVLNNRRRHLAQAGLRAPDNWIDPLSSGRSFPFWQEGPRIQWKYGDPFPDPVVVPRTWLHAVGWSKVGRPSINDIPGPARDQLHLSEDPDWYRFT